MHLNAALSGASMINCFQGFQYPIIRIVFEGIQTIS